MKQKHIFNRSMAILLGVQLLCSASVFAANDEAPSVVITGPGEGAAVSGNVQISAAANDNTGVTKVTFGVDGVWVGKDTSAPYTLNWDSTRHADGIA